MLWSAKVKPTVRILGKYICWSCKYPALVKTNFVNGSCKEMCRITRLEIWEYCNYVIGQVWLYCCIQWFFCYLTTWSWWQMTTKITGRKVPVVNPVSLAIYFRTVSHLIRWQWLTGIGLQLWVVVTFIVVMFPEPQLFILALGKESSSWDGMGMWYNNVESPN